MRKITLLTLTLTLFTLFAFCQDIKLNQIGFYKNAQKIAVVPEAGSYIFQIIDFNTDEIKYRGQLSESKEWDMSGESNIRIANFSDFNEIGDFYLLSGNKRSHVFKIATDSLFSDLSVWSIKAFYLWRASIAIDSTYATFNGVNYAREEGHPDTIAYIHSSAASTARPVGTVLSSPKGWYDAGDYNKYVVNANQGVFPLLHAYELYPEYYNNLNLNIPESSNNIPDILDEVKWELDWLLTMQDPNDGGVYHKLSHLSFSPEIMPHEAIADRYFMKKSTAATLDFAAMMAKAYRIFKQFDTELPGYADNCLAAAEYAYQWARNHPADFYTNPSDVSTGSYSDYTLSDEFFWAKTELFIATSDTIYSENLNVPSVNKAADWPTVSANGLLSYMNVADTLQMPAGLANTFTRRSEMLANYYLDITNNSAYQVGINEFRWGSNGYAASLGTVLISAYKYSNDETYLNAALSMLDYLLGRNATPYCFVTGFGDYSPMHIHCRRSESDGIEPPLPGYLAGGPDNGHLSDGGCNPNSYPSTFEAKAYVDGYCSFATNEVAINWNAPLAFLANAIEAEFQNSSIRPERILTDTTGTIISIVFPEPLSISDSSTISAAVFSASNNYTINSTEIDESMSIINLVLSDTITSEDTIYISAEFANILNNSKPIRSIPAASVVNCTDGSLPIVLFATTDSLGQSLTLTFSRELSLSATNATNGLTVSTDGNSNIAQSSYVDTTNRRLLHIITDAYYNNDLLSVSYDSDELLSSDGSTILPFELFVSENIAPQSPITILEAITHDDGYKIELFFNNSVQIDESVTEPITARYNSTNASISNYSYDEFSILVELNERYTPTDLILINTNTDFTNADGEIAEIFSNFEVTNRLSQLTPLNISFAEETKLIMNDYQYIKNIDITIYSRDYRMRYISDESWIDIPVNVINSGEYSIQLYYSSPTENQNLSIIDFSNETEDVIETFELPTTYYSSTWRYMDTILTLNEGEKLLRFKADSSVGITWINFQSQNNDTTSIDNNISTKTSVISPNPCNGTFTLTTTEESNVKIITADGITVIEETLYANTKKSYTLSSSGIYFITINDKTYKQVVD